MSQRLFPKPQPAEPLPEEIWLERTDRSEVGREPFFAGRADDYDVFRKAAISLRSGLTGGGTLIFQGAPGAGKSALMLECIEAIRQHSTPEEPWVAALLYPDTLKSPADVMTGLIDAANRESRRLSEITPDAIASKFRKLAGLSKKLCAELSERGVGAAGISVGGKVQVTARPNIALTSAQVFQDAAPLLKQFHIVVFVDEAQNIPVTDTTQGVLDRLHRGSEGISLVAAFFGLSDTLSVLRQCGLSRFAADRVVNLEPLSMEETASSFRCLLDRYFTGKEKQRALWANALAELSQGWPQHVNRIGVAAGRVIRANQGRLAPSLLEQALAKGAEQKNDYYTERIEAGSSRAWVYRRLALAAGDKKGILAGTLSYDEIDLLTETARERKKETMDEFLADALHAGILAPVRKIPDQYKIPIPSLASYLLSLPVEPPQTI